MKLLGTPILHWLTFLTWTLWTLLMIFPSLGHLIGNFFRTLALKSKHRVWNMWPQLPISVEADVRREDFLSERGAWQNMQRTWDFNLSVNWKSETWSSMQFLHEEQEQFILSYFCIKDQRGLTKDELFSTKKIFKPAKYFQSRRN